MTNSPTSRVVVEELPPTEISAASGQPIRNFRLSANSIDVELCSLGASITKLLLPDYSASSPPPPSSHGSKTKRDDLPSSFGQVAAAAAAGDGVAGSKARAGHRDDVVLSFSSPKEQHVDKNGPYFGSVVGRVANRIQGGRFKLVQLVDEKADHKLESYHVDTNNEPNHLHGGFDGFCHKIWDAEIIELDDNSKAIKFTLISRDGDQGYPASIEVSATYALMPNENGKHGANLRLSLHASLLPGEQKATPVSLAQHSYFNLASHASPNGVLDHVLQMPNCPKFTPVNEVLIPTRQIQSTEDAGKGRAMDFRSSKSVSEALVEYGIEIVGLDEVTAKENSDRRSRSGDCSVAKVPEDGGVEGSNLIGGEPYGFDHNFIIDRGNDSSPETLVHAATLLHPPTGRSLSVFTTAPGVQLYTANYLDGTNPSPKICKDNAAYNQWQALCLETQTFPDSVYPWAGIDNGDKSEIPAGQEAFATGKCFVLRPGGDDYRHEVEYRFGDIND